jgi:hypothetical protein
LPVGLFFRAEARKQITSEGFDEFYYEMKNALKKDLKKSTTIGANSHP